MTDIYKNARLYDLAFSYRDYSREVTVIELWFARHSRLSRHLRRREDANPKPVPKLALKRVPKLVLELACGPARHALEFAARGCEVTALDLSASMCKYARNLAHEERLSMRVVQGDMIDIRLPGTYDLTITMLDSVSHILTIKDMLKHLRAVANKLTPGGICVIETALESAQKKKTTVDEWQVEDGDDRLKVLWSSSEKSLRGRPHVFQTHSQLLLTGSKSQSFASEFFQREWTRADFISALKRCDSLKLVATYGAFEEGKSFRAKDAWRAIYVLLKK